MSFGFGEKRHSRRIELRTPIRYQIRGSADYNSAISDNISEGGLALTTDRFIPVATTVMFQIKLLSHILNPIGRIAWAQTVAHSDKNRFGVEFMELNPLEKNYLADYINMHLV